MSTSPNDAFQPPFRIKKYECLELLGGNMALVFRARDEKADREVIVKILRPKDATDPELHARFAQEARMACRCQHENIVATFETDEDGDVPYIVMEYLRGDSLRTVLKRGPLAAGEALRFAFQVAQALEYLHSIQIVHRDIKPENIIIDANQRAKLFDFGVSRFVDSKLTQAGQVIGSPAYMSPEQVTGGTPGQASDIYAFGVTLFEMLTLASPYRAQTPQEFWAAIVHAEPNLEPLTQSSAPPELTAIIRRCLEKDPEQRYPSFTEVCDALSPFVDVERNQTILRRTRIEQPATEQSGAKKATVDTTGIKPAPVQLPENLSVVRKLGSTAAGVAVVVVVAALVWFFGIHHGSNPESLSLPSGDMVLVEGGDALIGPNRQNSQVPAFYIDKTEVSNRAYLNFCRVTKRVTPEGALEAPPDYPIVNVSFEDAQAFAKWSGKRLPTAVEWEKAARGSKGQTYPWGNEWRADAANLRKDGSAPAGTLARVDGFANGKSPYGALNMVGNAWEWVATPDMPDEAAFAALAKMNDLNPSVSHEEPFYRVRGGSYQFFVPSNQAGALVLDWTVMPGRAKKSDIGFRCAKDL